MKQTNLGEKYTERITIRITEEQSIYLNDVATLLSCKPSDFIRMLINSSYLANKENMYKNEDKKTDKHD